MTLRKQIVVALMRANGAKLTIREIAAKLGMVTGDMGEGWENVGRIARELSRLEEGGGVHSELSAGDIRHWIVPLREKEGAMSE